MAVKLMKKKEAIQLWKALKVTSVDFNFSCGGDSMNDTDIVINTEDGQIENELLVEFFDEEVYKNVEFYVNSDGHYQGEAGAVQIVLEDEDEDFTYSKTAESEWSEQHTESINIKLTDVEQAFIEKNVLNINGESSNLNFVFKGDVFLSDDDEEFLEKLENKIVNEISDYEPEVDEGELSDYITYNTDEDNLTINENGEIKIELNYSVTVYRESED
jgi:hypothetical protein